MSELNDSLTEMQRKFCQLYLDNNFNKTKAAREAGYSASGASVEGNRLLKNAKVREEIKRLAEEQTLSSEETVKIISDIAKADIKDYLVTRKVERRKKIKKSLSVVIQEVEDRISFEKEFVRRVPISDEEEQKKFDKMINSLQREIVRYEIELERNPKAFRIDYSEPELVDEVELDLVKIKKDKEGGRIKSFKYGKYGPEIEFYSAADMAVNMARIYGRFKDNLDLSMNGSISIDKWLEENSDDNDDSEEEVDD